MVGGGVTVVGVAVGVFMQVQVGVGEVDDGGDGGPEGPPGGTVVAVASGPPLGDVDASAELETNITVKLVAASAMLASPAIFARFVSFNAVTRLLLAAGKRARTGGLRPVAPLVIALQCAGVPVRGTPGRNAIERQACYGLVRFVVMR